MLIFFIVFGIQVIAEDPVDKLQEFQKLMQAKVKVPKKHISEYDSDDIFSDGYTTVSESEMITEHEYQEEDEYDEQQEEDDLEAIRLEQERIEQEQILEEQRQEEERKQLLAEEKKRKQAELKKQAEMERIQEEEERRKKKKKKPIIILSDSESEDELLPPPPRRKQKQEEILEIMNEPSVKKKISLKDFEELEILKEAKNNVQQPEVKRIPGDQINNYIHFKNTKNNLEIMPCSNNPSQQRPCTMCNSEEGFQLDDDNWYLIGLEHGYKKEFLQLLESTKAIFGDTQLYLSFASDNSICLSSDSLKKPILIEDALLKHSDRSVKHFIRNPLFEIPQYLDGKAFAFKVKYQNRDFQFSNFTLSLAGRLQSGPIVVQDIEFKSEQLSALFNGIVRANTGEELKFSLKLTEGELISELTVTGCQLPGHTDLILKISDLYFGPYFRESLENRIRTQSFKGDLKIIIDNSDGKLKMKLTLSKNR